MKYNVDDKTKQLLREIGNDKDYAVHSKAMASFVEELNKEYKDTFVKHIEAKNNKTTAAFNDKTPLRAAMFRQDLVGDIYTAYKIEPGASPEFPLDFVAEGEQDDYVAFLMPKQGYVPERRIESDKIYVNTFRVANAIDWDLAYARDARWDVIARAVEVFNAGFVKRSNDDGWHVILAAALATGEMVNDAAATAGVFTKALINKMKTRQRRRALGGTLTDLYVSPEAIEDIYNWDLDDVDDVTRKLIYDNGSYNGEDAIIRIYGINVRNTREFGEGGQEYQDYFTTTLGGSLAGGGDLELVIGIDGTNRDCFVRPIREEIQMFPDPMLHRQGRAGFYGWGEHGFGALDTRRVLPGSF